MTDHYIRARSIDDKLDKTQADWREMVQNYLAAGEDGEGLTNIQVADCFNWSGDIMLQHYDDKSPQIFKEALRILEKVQSVAGLPNWYDVVTNQLRARIAPASYGFNSGQVDVGSDSLIESLVVKLVHDKGVLEAASVLPFFLGRAIFDPVLKGRSKSFAENARAVRALDKMIHLIYDRLSHTAMGEVGFTCRGLLYQYCMPKTLASFNTCLDSYKAAIRKNTLIENGAACAYVHLIDLLERPRQYGFENFADINSSLHQVLELREQRENWYRTDPSRRLMYWEMQTLVNEAFGHTVLGLPSPSQQALERAVHLGHTILAESNSSLFKQWTAGLLGWIYQHRLAASSLHMSTALKHYRTCIELSPTADGSIKSDLTFVNMSEADRIRANTARSEKVFRALLQSVLPLCYFPERNTADLPQSEFDSFLAFLLSHAKESKNQAAQLISKCVPEYAAFVERLRAMMARSQPELRQDPLILSKVAEVSTTILELVGTQGSSAKVQAKEAALLTTRDIVNSFHADPAMFKFYVGFARTFSEVQVSSLAISSGTVSADTSSLAVSGASFLLSMVPLVGNAAAAALEVGYDQYMSVKLESCADQMVAVFPMDAVMSDAVLQVLVQVHRDCLPHLRELDAQSDKIMTGLLAKLQGQLESLKGLIAAQRKKSDMEKISAQVAMGVIEGNIYAGRLAHNPSLSETTALLTLETLRSVREVHAQREALANPPMCIALPPVPPLVVPTNPVYAKDAKPTSATPKTAPTSPLSPEEMPEKSKIKGQGTGSSKKCVIS